MADRRYSTARWQKLRRAILYQAGGLCQVRGPRCTGYATTVHHIHPSSTHPHLFWEPANLAAACTKCNYGGGARVGADNRRERIAQLERVIADQQASIDRLLERIAELEKPRPVPAIY